MSTDNKDARKFANVPPWTPIELIDSEEHFFGREHVQTFTDRHLQAVSRATGIRAFGALVIPGRRQTPPRIARENPAIEKFEPIKYGLVVATRQEVGFPPLSKRYLPDSVTGEAKERANRVIQAGSFVTFMDNYTPEEVYIPEFTNIQQTAMRRLGEYLKGKFKR